MILLQAAATSAPTPTWSIIIGSAVISTAVSGIISYIMSMRAQQAQYFYDYKKYILEKRKAAYDDAQQLISYFDVNIDIETNDNTINVVKQCFVPVNKTHNPIADALDFIVKLNSQSIYLSDKLLEKLSILNVIVKDLRREFYFAKIGTEPYYKAVSKTTETLNTLTEELAIVYFADLKELDNIKTYLKNKKRFSF